MSGKTIPVWRVNAFTTTPFSGNPAGVVPDADGLSDELMLAIAGELNDVSETVFICRPDTADADIKLRFFTTTTEVDLCGHATISALFVLAWLNRIKEKDAAKKSRRRPADPGWGSERSSLDQKGRAQYLMQSSAAAFRRRREQGSETRIIRAETRVGVLELGMQFEHGKPAWASMEQLAPQIYDAPGAGRVAAILGLPAAALSDQLKTGCASSGLWACFVPLRDLAALRQVRIDSARIEQIWPDNPEFTGVYPFVLIDENTTQGRFFSPPKYGILEDPVTGTACGALCAWLMAQGLIPPNGELLARQGFEMGRGGQVKVRRNTNGKMLIQGQAVAVLRGEIITSRSQNYGGSYGT